jgi:hypothetical protein
MTLKLGVGVLCVLLLAVGVLIGMEIRGKCVQAAADGRYVMEVGVSSAYWVVLDTSTGTSIFHMPQLDVSKTRTFAP